MTEYALHYIGTGLYSEDSFGREARKHGVARAMGASWLRSLKWGDIVLLARWIRAYRPGGQPIDPTEPKIGSARVFGYFVLTGLNMDASDAAKAAVHKRLHVTEVVTYEEPEMVERACGSYGIGSAAVITDTLEQVLNAVRDAEAETGERVKLFMTGHYEKFPVPLTLDPATFTRTLSKVDIEVSEFDLRDLKPDAGDGHRISYVLDYAARRYVRKDDRERLGDIMKDVRP